MVRNRGSEYEQPAARRPHLVAPAVASIRLVFINHRALPLPGSDAGLSVTTNMTCRVLRRAGVHAETWDAKDVNGFVTRFEREEYRTERPITHVVFNTPNFATPRQIGEFAQRWYDTEFIQLNHTGLSYLCIDDSGPRKIREVQDLQRAMPNVKVGANNPRVAKTFGDIFGVPPILLPNLYDTDSFVDPVFTRKNHDPLRVGCFGEGRPWKNQTVAALAALIMARRLGVKLELYVNADRWPQTWDASRARQELFDGNPSASLIAIPWQPWPTFRKTVSTMDICLHPSYCETFCVVVGDGIAEGVPSVVTSAAEWTPHTWWTAHPHDPASVAAVGMSLLQDTAGAVADGRQALRDFVETGTRKWIDYLTA